LLEEPTPTQLKMLEYIAETFVNSGNQWPVFDYVEGRFDSEGIDAWTELQTLPAHPQGYYAVALPRQQRPEPDKRIALTMLGLFQAEVMGHMHTDLSTMFIGMLQIMARRRRDEPRSANSARSFEISSQEMVEDLAPFFRSKGRPDPDLLGDLLDREPPTWPVIQQRSDGEWAGRIPRGVLRFVGVEDIRDYLGRLVEMLTMPTIVAPPAAPSPLGLVAAIDYMDTVWRLAQPGVGHLFQLHSAQRTAQLAFEANTAAEFESRLSSLGDILRSFRLPPMEQSSGKKGKKERDKPLGPLEDHLLELLPESHVRIEGAIAVLHNVIAVRDAGQHGPAGGKGANALAALGVGYPPASWPEAWSTISARTIDALDSLREELATLT
jgi:hypothetical protein